MTWHINNAKNLSKKRDKIDADNIWREKVIIIKKFIDAKYSYPSTPSGNIAHTRDRLGIWENSGWELSSNLMSI